MGLGVPNSAYAILTPALPTTGVAEAPALLKFDSYCFCILRSISLRSVAEFKDWRRNKGDVLSGCCYVSNGFGEV